LENLCATYRSPLLAWARSRGESREDAEDHVQGFLEHLIKDASLSHVGPEKGRFRTFLLTSFQNYLKDLRKQAQAGKRGGGHFHGSLDETDQTGEPIHHPATGAPAPDLAYDQAWAAALLANALRRLEAECARTGHAALCRELEPALFNDSDAPAYAQIGQRLTMSETAVKTAAHRIRRRLGGIIRDEVSQTVVNDTDLEAELAYLLSLFARPSASAA
jgi:RNA polymerase sigma-70 factor (ECF subfamily)